MDSFYIAMFSDWSIGLCHVSHVSLRDARKNASIFTTFDLEIYISAKIIYYKIDNII